MNTNRVIGRLELAQMKLLLCTDPDRAQNLIGEIHALKANLYRRRQRDQKYRDQHRAMQAVYRGRDENYAQ